ncbi:MAG TPA: hypothetical protein VLQ47_10825, partial [Rhodoferax sp.]|nr:hypothetical protein [Rhodoferax sp.]
MASNEKPHRTMPSKAPKLDRHCSAADMEGKPLDTQARAKPENRVTNIFIAASNGCARQAGNPMHAPSFGGVAHAAHRR